MKLRSLLAVCAIGTLVYGGAQAASPSWPAIRPVQRTFNVPDVKKMNLSLLIHTKVGVPLYGLFCSPPTYISNNGSYNAEYGVDYVTDFRGDFACLLAMRHSGPGLLVESAMQPYVFPSRGEFDTRELAGICGSIPNFGATRNFRLRGMKLTLQVIDPVIDVNSHGWDGPNEPELKSMKLKVTVRPDPSATRAIAAIVPFPKAPPPQCKLSKNFVNPATFSKLARRNPQYIDWKTVPVTRPSDWNRKMQVGVTPSHCDTQLEGAATFRGKLVATRLRTHGDGQSGPSTLNLIILKLDHPINICSPQAPDLATTTGATESKILREMSAKHHVRVPATFARATRAKARGLVNRLRKWKSRAHVTALYPSEWDLNQFGASEPPFVGHQVEIRGFIDAGGPQGIPSNLPFLIVEGICLVDNGRLAGCSSFPGRNPKQ